MQTITAHPVLALAIVGGVFALVIAVGMWLLLRGTHEEDEARERAAHMQRERVRTRTRDVAWAEIWADIRRQVEAERVRQQRKDGR